MAKVTTETDKAMKRRGSRFARAAALLAVLLCLLPVCAYLLAVAYLHTTSAARRTSRLLSAYLHYPVTVAGLGLAGRTLSIDGLTVGNRPGFKGGELASSRSITIAPDWWSLLHGDKRFAAITLQDVRVSLDRNAGGEWNFHELARLLSQKKGGGETFIGRLSINHASLAVEGFRLDNLALRVNDLSTRGSAGASLLLTGRDAQGDPFRLEGSARLGGSPSANVAFTAPAISLERFALKGAAGSVRGRGALALGLKLQDGKLAVRGKLGVQGLALAGTRGGTPVDGEAAFAGRYDLRGDALSLDDCSVRLDGLLRGRASGTVREARTKRVFTATVAVDGIDLKTMSSMLPPERRRDLALAGTLGPVLVRLSGDAAHGITAGGGTISLREGALARGGMPIVSGVAVDGALAKVKEGWRLAGTVTQGRDGADGALKALHARYAASFTGRLKLLAVEVPSFAASIYGFPAAGEFAYRPGEPVPLTVRAEGKGAAASFNRLLAGKNLTLAAGTAAISLRGSGRGPRDIRGELKLVVAGVRGSMAGKEFAVTEGTTEAGISASAGHVSAAGKIRWSGGVVDGKKVALACAYGFSDGNISLSDGTVSLDRAELRFGRIYGQKPLALHAGKEIRLPLRIAFEDVAVRSGTAGVDGVSGSMTADYVSEGGRRRLEGDGAFTVKALTYREQQIGAMAGGVRFTGAGATTDFRGSFLKGSLSGTVSIDPFDAEKRTAFTVHLDRASFGAATSLAPDTLPLKVTEGLVGGKLTGSYGRSEGIRCRLVAGGRGVTLVTRRGRTLLAGGEARTIAELAKDTLSIREGVVSAGSGVVLRGSGELTHPFSPEREGGLDLSLPDTSLSDLLSALANVLPRSLQEASATGTIGAVGRLRFSRRRAMLDGEVSLAKVGVEITSQKLSAEGITGTVPLSLDFSGTAAGGRPVRQTFSRANYPSLLASLHQAASGKRSVKAGTIRFGGMELGSTSLAITAANGLTEVSLLESSLFGGTVLGEGFFRYGRKPEYGADLIVNDLSLRALCAAYPKIKGYIAGRVDGIVSLYGEGTEMNGLRGFTNIWTRSGHGEKMLVSKEFLQKLAGRKLKGIFFRNDRPYDRGEIRGFLEKGYLTFDTLDISHTNFFGIRDLSVTVAPVQNRIAIGHLIASIREAATRGKAAGTGQAPPPQPPPDTEFKWEE